LTRRKPKQKTPWFMEPGEIRIGAAGWRLPKANRERFGGEGTHLERYAARLGASEINATFKQSFKRSRYEKWAASVPATFRFSVKAPRAITHQGRLENVSEPLEAFLDEIAGLGEKLGPLLFQLPPELTYARERLEAFCRDLRAAWAGPAALEPRHASWNAEEANAILADHGIARVAADPERFERAGQPAGAESLVYYRWHGAPRMYYSSYENDALERLKRECQRHRDDGRDAWCIFDNTAGDAGVHNAVDLAEMTL